MAKSPEGRRVSLAESCLAFPPLVKRVPRAVSCPQHAMSVVLVWRLVWLVWWFGVWFGGLGSELQFPCERVPGSQLIGLIDNVEAPKDRGAV